MGKRAVTFIAVLGMTVGGLVPMALGWDPTGLGGPSVLGGLVGGIAAIWLAIKLGNRFSL